VTLPEKQQRLLDELAPLADSQARLAWLVDRARSQPLLPAQLRTDAHRIEGCLSKLWFVPEFRDGRCWFQAESDSLFVKATAGLLCEFYSGETPGAILAQEPEFLRRLGFSHHLTPHRRSTLDRVWQKIRDFAAHQVPATAS